MSKGIVYYSDCRLDETIAAAVRKQIAQAASGMGIVSVTLAPVDFGNNITLNLKRSPLTFFTQILTGLEASTADVIFFCKADVLYHPSHFDFTPARADTFYYNRHAYRMEAATGRALFNWCHWLGGLCAYRELLTEHYRTRVAQIHKLGALTRFVPGEPGIVNEQLTGKVGAWMSLFPKVDIRHDKNLTTFTWDKKAVWLEADEIPGWDAQQSTSILAICPPD